MELTARFMRRNVGKGSRDIGVMKSKMMRRMIATALAVMFVISVTGCGSEPLVAHSDPYELLQVLENSLPDVQGRRTNDNPINKDGLYEDIDFLQEGGSKDNPSIVTIGTNKAGKKIEGLSLMLHSGEDVYDTVHLVIGNLVGEEQAEQILQALKIDKEKGYIGKEDFFGESTEDFSEYDYSVGLISDDLILINVMVKDHPSVRSQLYGFQD